MNADTILGILRRNVGQVRETIAQACRRSGRDAGSVRLVAVTKYVELDVIAGLLELGLRDIGESRVQQLVQRAGRLGATPGGLNADSDDDGRPVWHLIGHLQRNKIRPLLPHCTIVHSLDSIRLAEELNSRAESAKVAVDVFLEVNAAGEASKTGVSPEDAAPLAEAASKLPRLRLRGFMTMAPPTDDPREARPCFAALRALRDRLQSSGVIDSDCEHLSMGMSGDYQVAVEEGATIVRIGSALFEGLAEPRPSAQAR
jgi:hypothetical protein